MEFLRKELLKIKNGDEQASLDLYMNITDHFNVDISGEDFVEWLEEYVAYTNDKELINLVEEVVKNEHQ